MKLTTKDFKITFKQTNTGIIEYYVERESSINTPESIHEGILNGGSPLYTSDKAVEFIKEFVKNYNDAVGSIEQINKDLQEN